MLELLNKFAWFLCFALSFAICNTIFGREMMQGGFIIAIIASFALKGFVFPENYILSRLRYFKDHISNSKGAEESSSVSQEKVELEEINMQEQEIQEEVKDFENNKLENESLEIEESEKGEDENIYLSETREIQEEDIEDDDMYEEQSEDTQEVISSPKILYNASSDTPRPKKVQKEPNVFEKFFAENLLAKVGGIFVFLGVLFLLGLVYTMIGPGTKLALGFIVGGLCYGAGVWLDKKGYIEESRIVLGVAILINYLVILWGRYFLGSDESTSATLLSVGFTFFLLITNTILGVITSELYKSRALLIFAFVAAYLNPFLIGGSSSEPYTLLGYTMIVTLGAMFISYSKKDEVLFPLSFVFAAILIIIAPWSDGAGWIGKLLCINSLGVIGLYVSTEFKKRYKFGFEVLISATFFLIGIMGVLGGEILSSAQYIAISASSLGLMGICYAYMHRGAYLYSIGTLGTILTLTPVILLNGVLDGYGFISGLIVITFGVMNIGASLYKSKKLLGENINNTISGLISGSLFLILMIYMLGNVYLSGILQGICFFALSLIYGAVAYLQAKSIGFKNISINREYENLIYSIFALGISLLTLSIAFIFAENKAIVCIAWLLEANVLFYLATRIKSQKTALLGNILLIIGVVKFIDFTDLINIFTSVPSGSYGMLISFAIIFLSYVLNLVFITSKDTETDSYLGEELGFLHNVFHIIGMSFLLLWGHQIIGITDNWISLLYASICIMTLGVIYEKLAGILLQRVHLGVYLGAMGVHILLFFTDIGTDRLQILLSTIIAGIYALPFIYDYFIRGKIQSQNLFCIFTGYIFTLCALYLYHIFGTSFAITSFWALITFAFISYFYTRTDITQKHLVVFLAPMAIVYTLLFEMPEIVTVGLLLQSLLLMFYGYKNKSQTDGVYGLIVFIIGVFVMYGSLTPLYNIDMIGAGFIALIITMSSLCFTQEENETSYLTQEYVWIYNITHALAVGFLAYFGHELIDFSNDWFSLLYFGVVLMILGVVYENFSGPSLQKIHLAVYILLLGTHLLFFVESMQTSDMNLVVSTFMVGIFSLPFIYEYIKQGKIKNIPLFIVFLSYLFILSSLYIYQIFAVTFMVTLYWGVLAFAILWYGIAKDILAVRTIGLYLITLTATKVFLYDIWMSVDDTVSRVIALIVVGILMIVLSTMYTKKFGNNLNAEFKFSNLFPRDNSESHNKYRPKQEKVTVAKSKVQQDIEKIDVGEFSGVKLKFGDDKAVQIRAENLVKIAKLIANTYKKTDFKAGELEQAYELIESDYKSDLSPSQYTKIRSLVKRFVDVGGSIEFIKK